MRFFANPVRSLAFLERQSPWIVMLVLGLLAGTSLGQGPINLSKTGLHDGQSIYGIDGSLFLTPWTNNDSIRTLLGLGETDPDLYSNVSFIAYGIYSNVNLLNLAEIDVNAVGGNASTSEGEAEASVRAYGIFANPEGGAAVENSGNITVTAWGGTAQSTAATALGYAEAYGISASDTLTNSGVINVSSTGGTADSTGADGFARAYARAYGLYANGEIINSGTVTATATGGTATSSGGSEDSSAQAFAEAFGLYADGGVESNADITVSATGGNASAVDGNAPAFAAGYGILVEPDAEVNNNGNITVDVLGGTASSTSNTADAYAEAYGISGQNTLTNSGFINVSGTGGTADSTGDGGEASAYARVYGLYSNGQIFNNGPVAATATGGTATSSGGSEDSSAQAFAEAFGLYADGGVESNADITVSATGGNASAVDGNAPAFAAGYGILVEPDAQVNNNGNITVSVLGGTASSSSGTTDAYAEAYGISGQVTLINNGSINVSGTGGTADSTGDDDPISAYARVYGLHTNAEIINSGAVAATAVGGTASSGASEFSTLNTQAYAEAFGIQGFLGVENSGDINVLATGGTVTAEDGTLSAGAEAYGIYSVSGEVSNTGNITVTAMGGTVNPGGGTVVDNAAYAYGIRAMSDVDNSGDITVTAETEPDGSMSRAYGIYMGDDGDSNLTNTGTIRAFGDDAYELYIAGGTTTIIDTYNVTLDGDPCQASIFVGSGATLNLNNAALTVTDVQGDVEGATLWNTEYRLFEVAGEEGEGTIAGSFNSVAAVNPDVTATYFTHGTENAADDTVALAYTPQASEALASSSVEKRVAGMGAFALNQHMTMDLLYDTLALDETDEESGDDSTGDTAQKLSACQRSGGAFFQPSYSYIEKDNDPLGYEAGMSGVSGGYSQCVNSSLLGLHVGYGKANINYTGAGYSANTEDQEVVTSGFSGMTRFRPWIFRYGFTGFHGWHEYNGLTGAGLTETETAKFNSYGGTGLIMVGRTFRHDRHVFLPEIGANWLWVHREGYTTEATDPAWDTTYSTLNDNDVWAQAALNWQSLYKYKKIQISPFASIGIRQLLTDGETEIWQSVPGAARVQIEDEQDETAVALASSVVLRGRRTALTLAYDGEYSSDIQQHNFWMKFRLRF